MSSKKYWVYILASSPRGTLYTGVTGNLAKRINQHRKKSVPGFTEKYNISMLVYAEPYCSIYEALQREKQLKKWQRQWKMKRTTA